MPRSDLDEYFELNRTSWGWFGLIGLKLGTWVKFHTVRFFRNLKLINFIFKCFYIKDIKHLSITFLTSVFT